MTGGDLNNLFRVYAAEPDNQGRWSDTDAYSLINEAQKYIALKLEWPVVHFTAVPPSGTTAGQQEYTLPELLKIERVYLQGQPCVPTDIATLEGTQIGFYDQTSVTTPYTPNWNSQTAATYPVTNTQFGYPNGVSPFYIGQRPQFYLNGGNIGFVPPPASQYTIDIWGIGVPRLMGQATDVCDFPSIFESAIAWKAVEIAFTTDSQLEKAQAASLKFLEWLPELRVWKRDLLKNRSRGPRLVGYRHFFRRGSSYGTH